jgi:hypothetical protein
MKELSLVFSTPFARPWADRQPVFIACRFSSSLTNANWSTKYCFSLRAVSVAVARQTELHRTRCSPFQFSALHFTDAPSPPSPSPSLYRRVPLPSEEDALTHNNQGTHIFNKNVPFFWSLISKLSSFILKVGIGIFEIAIYYQNLRFFGD